MTPDSSTHRWLPWLLNAALVVGAATAAGWSMVELLRPPVPASKVESHPETEEVTAVAKAVDAAIAATWSAKNLTPVQRAEDLAIMRRLSLALTGSIPSLQEIREAEAARPADIAQWWLARLLADRRSADYLAERLVRVYVGTENGPFLIYRRRRLVEWLSQALQQNRPYDEVVRALIAGTGVWTTSPEVNFITVTNTDRKGPDEAKLAARVSRAFLGVRIDCVQCHDGKLGSSWKQADFHRLAACFGQAEFALNGLRDDPRKTYKVRYLGKMEEEVVPPMVPWQPDMLPAKGTPRASLAAWVTSKENKPFARAFVNRLWALLFNRPLVAPVDDLSLQGPFPPGMDLLAEDFAAHGFDVHRLLRVMVATQAFQLASQSADPGHPVTAEAEQAWAAFPLTRLRPEQMAGSVIQAASLTTLDAETHVLFRIKRSIDVDNFVKRYGDSGEDSFEDTGGTIPQRLLLMNGNMITDNTRSNPLVNAGTRIALLAPDDATAVEAAYLAIFTRRPTAVEQAHFTALLASAKSRNQRGDAMSDLCWTLMNATEFSWNH